MVKKAQEPFDDENEAFVLLPEDQTRYNDAVIIVPSDEEKREAFVLMPDAETHEDTLLFITDENGVQRVQRKEKKLANERHARETITKRVIDKSRKKHKSPEKPSWRKLGISTLTNLPSSLAMVHSFMRAVNWKEAQEEVLEGLGNTIVIVGQPNTGKSTLFNQLKGQHISEVSAEAGTTKRLIRSDFGPFTLIDTPGHLPDVMETGMEEASLIVFLIDGAKGLQPDDRNLLMTIKNLNKPTVIAVNKVDTLKNPWEGDELANEIAMRLGTPGVIPISARSGTNIAEELVPAMINASPEAALVIGKELPEYRRQAARRIIRNSMLVSLAAGLEPVPLIDIPILLGTQIRLVLRIAALYGEPVDSTDAMKHARELIVTMVSGLGLRYLAEQAAKAIPIGGDVLAGAIAGAATWSIGEVAMEYYESGKRFDAKRLRTMTNMFYRRFRKEKNIEELRGYRIEAENEPEMLAIEAPTNENNPKQ